jgi:uncharacterized membrane protein
LRIPATAKSGTYDVDVTVYYDDYDEKNKETFQITVVGDEQAAQATTPGTATGKTTIAVGVQAQTVARGENGVIYPLTITNGANTAKTYILSVSGTADWATTRFSPSNVVILNPGESKQVYVFVAASENTALGEKVFSLDVKVGNDVVQQIPLKAEVLESANGSWDGVKRALQVGVILLVVLIVVLGVVIAYQRRSKGSAVKEDEQVAQTYY